MLNRYIEEEYFTEPIRDPLWGHIYLSEGLKSLVNTPVFQQLGRIKQLGPSFLVYPGATHTRLNHSLGVFHLGKRLIRSLISNPYCPSLAQEPVTAFLCACLLHDIGHFPYAHSLKELPLKEHESLAAEMILEGELKYTIKEKVKIDPYTVAQIIDESIATTDTDIGFFRNLLSGALDPDKLDYLNRDAFFCGVPYGVQDIDYAISVVSPAATGGLIIAEEGMSAVEHLLFAKYLMYRNVYWHKTVRSATGMIKKALFLALNEGILQPDHLYGLDDEEFNHRFSQAGSSCYSLISMVFNRRLYKSVYEEAFSETNPFHTSIQDLTERTTAEKELVPRLSPYFSRSLKAEDIIIDVPEKINFEIDIPVKESSGAVADFCETHSVFSPAVVRNFTSTLRKVRIFVHPEACLKEACPPDIFP